MNAWLGVIGSLFAIIIGLWKFFGAKAQEKRQRADDAKKKFNEGMAKSDTSEITASFDDINRS